MFFYKTVDAVIADIQDKVQQLEDLVFKHNNMAEEALKDHIHHGTQAQKANRIKKKLQSLIE